VNRQITEVLGYKPEAICETRLFENLIHPDDLPGLAEHIREFYSAQDGDILNLSIA